MDIKKILTKFVWKPEQEYSFSLPDTDKKQDNEYYPDQNLKLPINIFSDISKNIEYIKSRFNALINSDIVIRKFTLNIRFHTIQSFYTFY